MLASHATVHVCMCNARLFRRKVQDKKRRNDGMKSKVRIILTIYFLVIDWTAIVSVSDHLCIAFYEDLSHANLLYCQTKDFSAKFLADTSTANSSCRFETPMCRGGGGFPAASDARPPKDQPPRPSAVIRDPTQQTTVHIIIHQLPCHPPTHSAHPLPLTRRLSSPTATSKHTAVSCFQPKTSIQIGWAVALNSTFIHHYPTEDHISGPCEMCDI